MIQPAWLDLLASGLASCLPAGGAGDAAAAGEHILPVGNAKAGQIQEVSDHLTFDRNIQRRVGVEAVPKNTSTSHTCSDTDTLPNLWSKLGAKNSNH